MKTIFNALIRFYKRCISPLLPHVCIYTPSCSTYMLQAIEEYGAIKGLYLGIKRLLMCAPWGKGGYDPLKSNPKGAMKWVL